MFYDVCIQHIEKIMSKNTFVKSLVEETPKLIQKDILTLQLLVPMGPIAIASPVSHAAPAD